VTNPIEVRGLSFRYTEDSRTILSDINLDVERGQIVAVVGLSGIGKSTLCYCISGIIPHVYGGIIEGEVYLDGVSTREMALPSIAKTLGVVFQNPDNQLFSPTVEDEIAFGPENLCVPRREIADRIDDALAKVGMKDFRLSSPHRLSGGQRQLIALASVLSLHPQTLIFDEAMSQIDSTGQALVKNIMEKLRQEGKTIVMIEHDLDNLDIADRVLVLKKGSLHPFQGSLL
jgi:energy-coupling factor transport system ATP-binding protein